MDQCKPMSLGDEGVLFISEALAFNDVATCIDLSANGRGLHSSTFRHNVSAFRGIGGAFIP